MSRLRPISLKRAAKMRRLPSSTFTKKPDAEKKAKRYERDFGSKRDWIAGLSCCACDRQPPSDAAHVKSRGAGGTSADLVPLCRGCHLQQHSWGIETFEKRKGISLAVLAEELEIQWQESRQRVLPGAQP